MYSSQAIIANPVNHEFCCLMVCYSCVSYSFSCIVAELISHIQPNYLTRLCSDTFGQSLLPFLSNHAALCRSPDTSSHDRGASVHWYSTYCLQEPLYNLINADMSASVTSYVMFTRDARVVVCKLKDEKCEIRKKIKI